MRKVYGDTLIVLKREEYREALRHRLFFDDGAKVSVIKTAEVLSLDRGLVNRWKQTGQPLPEGFELQVIAESRGISPAWLAFNRGPKDNSSALAAEPLGALLEKTNGLKEMMDAYIAASEPNRAALRQLAGALTPAPLPTPARAPEGSLTLPLSPQELPVLRKAVNNAIGDVRFVTSESKHVGVLARRIDQLAAALKSAKQQDTTQSNQAGSGSGQSPPHTP